MFRFLAIFIYENTLILEMNFIIKNQGLSLIFLGIFAILVWALLNYLWIIGIVLILIGLILLMTGLMKRK
jgi:hypothetical protein